MLEIPSVVIVGRPNVGKSSLFNAIYGQRVAIVEPTPGVTRDRISRIIERQGLTFELVDMGGVGLHDMDELAEEIQMQIQIAVGQADLVLLITDARDGLQPLDEQIARELREAGKDVLLVVNKCDRRTEEAAAAEFYALGFPEMHMTSAAHRRGIGALVAQVGAALPEAAAVEESEEAEPMKIALVGRRNVGKSTLINYLAQEPRMVVSEIPGTTRDSVDVRFRMGDLKFVAIDTAGLRRRKQIKDSIDFYSAARSKAAIRRADVVVHMMEAPMEVGRLDKQLAGEIVAGYKPCVLAVNKMDLAPGGTEEDFEAYVRDRLPGVSFAPLVCISALSGEGVLRLIELADALHRQSFIRVPTSDLNKVVQEATRRNRPPSTGSRLGRIYYATQVGVKPPGIVLFANEPHLIGDAYLRYLASQLRGAFGFSAIPLKFILRARTHGQRAAEGTNHGH
ncbi:MAG: ribosome biogenesis GTPase Der [Planctomycetota bacterium]|jgi:GTP-binding protein